MYYRSEQINELAGALSKAQAEFPKIPKTQTVSGEKFSYKYAGLAEVINGVTPALSKNGLAILQNITTDNGSITVETTLLHASGQYDTSYISYKILDSKMMNPLQALGSQITYLRRYALSAKLNVASEEDTDTAEIPQQAQKTTTKTSQPSDKKVDSGGERKASDAQLRLIHARIKRAESIDDAAVKHNFALESWKDLPAAKVNDVLAFLDKEGGTTDAGK